LNIIFEYGIAISFKNSLIELHKFLASFRLTPRSRNVRKFKPEADVIVEELSVFESSSYKTSV